jgi:hypothetical protein
MICFQDLPITRIAQYFTIDDMFVLEQVAKYFKCLHGTRVFGQRVRAVLDGLGLGGLVGLIRQNKGMVAGSFLLDIMLGTKYAQDIDIYIPETNAHILEYMGACATHIRTSTFVPANMRVTGQATGQATGKTTGHPNTITTHTYTTHHKTIQLIVVPLYQSLDTYICDSFDYDFLMNTFDGNVLCVNRKPAIITRMSVDRDLANCRAIILAKLSRHSKYTARGWVVRFR